MSDLIDDRAVEDLRIVWEESPGYAGPRVVDAPPELRLIRDFLSRESWQQFAQFILPGVLNHHGRVMEYSGFRFQGDLDPDEERFQGVELFDPVDTIYISEHAFDAMMCRYFDAIVQGVIAHHRPEHHEVWWNSFANNARALKARLSE